MLQGRQAGCHVQQISSKCQALESTNFFDDLVVSFFRDVFDSLNADRSEHINDHLTIGSLVATSYTDSFIIGYSFHCFRLICFQMTTVVAIKPAAAIPVAEASINFSIVVIGCLVIFYQSV